MHALDPTTFLYATSYIKLSYKLVLINVYTNITQHYCTLHCTHSSCRYTERNMRWHGPKTQYITAGLNSISFSYRFKILQRMNGGRRWLNRQWSDDTRQWSVCRPHTHALHEKIREADLLPGSLDIFLHLSPVLSEGECPVKRRLFARADRRVVGRAEKVGNGVALRLGVRHHFVLHALVSVVAPRLQNATTHTKN